MTRPDLQIVLGIDGGGSSTICKALDLTGRTVGEGQAGPSNHLRNGLECARTSLRNAIGMTLRGAGCHRRQVVCSCAGLAGVFRRPDQEILFSVLSGIIPDTYWILEHDAFVALAGATDCRPGIVVVSGTGSIAFGIDSSGRRARAGGWGHVLGDEGSGYDMARRGVIAALKAFDGRGPETLIGRELLRELQLESLDSLIGTLYGPTVDIPRLASLFPLVLEMAGQGDEQAGEIVRQGALELALAALSVERHLTFSEEEIPIATAGGVFNNPWMRAEFQRALNSRLPRGRLVVSHFNPAQGAAEVARRCYLGLEVFAGDRCPVRNCAAVGPE